MESLTAQRRQAQEKLAQNALQDAKTKETETRAAAEAAAAAATNGTASVSAPTTPATTPGAIREGKRSIKPDMGHFLVYRYMQFYQVLYTGSLLRLGNRKRGRGGVLDRTLAASAVGPGLRLGHVCYTTFPYCRSHPQYF